MFKNVRGFASLGAPKKIQTNSNFSSYLAGLIEGDGSIAVHDPNSKSQKYRPKFIIVFKRSDLPLANYLCQLTGCGKVYDKPERGYVLWQIQKVLDVFKITSLINGYMRTPKQEALCRVIDWINDYIKNNKESKLPGTQKILSSIYPLKKEALDNSAIDSNAWLTGFIDSDGNFSISLNKRNKKHLDKVVNYMRLEVRQTYHRTNGNETQLCTNKSSLLDNSNSSYYFIMSKIAALWIRKSHLWLKLSNSEYVLRLIILNHMLTHMHGWINYLCIVINIKMTLRSLLLKSELSSFAVEIEMEYCVSKSVICESIAVKEQRTDGSWHSYGVRLRYVLKGFERNYLVKNLSYLRPLTLERFYGHFVGNQINKKSYTSISNRIDVRVLTTLSSSNLNPWFISGFVDGEGCFLISVVRNNKLKSEWRVYSVFKITLHKKDLPLLEQIKAYFGVGNIYKSGSEAIEYSVTSVIDLAVIIDHFDNYPLITQKQGDYLLFKRVVNIINNKEHLTISGLQKILSIRGFT